MPLLAALMLGLAAYSIAEGDVPATLRFLLHARPASHLTPRAALDALGLGFFSIGVGLGLMITYAAYSGVEIRPQGGRRGIGRRRHGDLASSPGFAVFPIVFAHGLDPAGGPGLVFVTLPLAFAQMPFGTLAAVAFFVLLFVAALASAISMLELVVALLMRRCGCGAAPATAIAAGAACFAAGIATVLSFNALGGLAPASASCAASSGPRSFDLLDYLTSNILLPLGGLAIAVFAGWAVPAQRADRGASASAPPARARVADPAALCRAARDRRDRGLALPRLTRRRHSFGAGG